MASIRATELKRGMAVVLDGQIFLVVKHDHHTPGNLRAIHQVYMRNLKTGAQKQQRYGSGDQIEVAYLDKKKCQYLYKDSTGYIFMDEQSYDQFPLPADVVADQMVFIKPNDTVDVTFHDATPLSVELPSAVTLTVVDTEEAVRGNTATNVTKSATVETGLVVKVPQHIKKGDRVKVSTDDQSFLGRVS